MHLPLILGVVAGTCAAQRALAQEATLRIGWMGGSPAASAPLRLSFQIPSPATELKVCRNASVQQCATGKAPSFALSRLGPSPNGTLLAFTKPESVDLAYTLVAAALDAKGTLVASRQVWVVSGTAVNAEAATQGDAPGRLSSRACFSRSRDSTSAAGHVR